ncbi:MAG TPA: T9SS type A sorting domain-containing protein [Flavobacterium sp.]|jgi:hypothetical protein
MKKIYFLILALSFLNDLSAQIINFPDARFKEWLLLSRYGGITYNSDYHHINIDANNDGEIEVSEVLNVHKLELIRSYFISIEGIEYFRNLEILYINNSKIVNLDLTGLPNLKRLDCERNNELVSVNFENLTNLNYLNVSGNRQLSLFNFDGLTQLKTFHCSMNKLVDLDITSLLQLETFSCIYNELKSLKVSNLPKLKSLHIDNNQLETINFEGLENVELLGFSNNLISSVNLDGLSNLESLYCVSNRIEYLDLSKLTKLSTLNCRDNQLLTLDASNTKLLSLDCTYNNLTSLFLKNGLEIGWNVTLDNNPNLKYVCIGESKRNFDVFWWTAINQANNIGDKNNIVINSYCSFMPGGDNYIIKGTTKFDSDSNGCNSLDFNYPNIKIMVSSNTNITENFIANTFGNYSIPVIPATYTLTPVLENPDYFSVLPTTTIVSFPTQVSPFIQDFCITPIGNHPDLEIILLPVGSAVPGFDAGYKIVYRNKGNIVKSGSVTLIFNNEILDYVSSNTPFNSQIDNNIIWNFANLRPFESREILFTLNVNRPTEIPAVNNGDVLRFTTTITSNGTDETPLDNTFTLNQTVVGSYDPNDKTCLEGTIITPDLIGNYVHYMIRFENTGTYPARNVVVKDMIDLSKFDISTLIPTSSSHSFITKISEGNKVEFIFENINLPFDDANNDGYVAFKIKTKPTLVVGDSFTNEANIYFDYNFPIRTNRATSTFQALGNQDFVFSNYFTLYPNPVDDILNLASTQVIEIKSVAIYDILGQIVIAVPNAKLISTIDVSQLKTGNYFIKVKSDKGSSSMKFFKK